MGKIAFHYGTHEDLQEVVELHEVKPEPREVMEVTPVSSEEVETYEGYDNYDGYHEGYQDDTITADSQNNSEQYLYSGPNTVTIGTEIFEKYSNAWRCGICKKMCSTNQLA